MAVEGGFVWSWVMLAKDSWFIDLFWEKQSDNFININYMFSSSYRQSGHNSNLKLLELLFIICYLFYK